VQQLTLDVRARSAKTNARDAPSAGNEVNRLGAQAIELVNRDRAFPPCRRASATPSRVCGRALDRIRAFAFDLDEIRRQPGVANLIPARRGWDATQLKLSC